MEKRHLPRLAPEFYRGRTFVHWTLTIDNRATGWLSSGFHEAWRVALLHTCGRYQLACPAYVLMPDHIHLLTLGLSNESDQRVAIEFLRSCLRPALTPVTWQHQAHDHVLRKHQRERGAFQNAAAYILNNPVRAGLVERREDYLFLGCCVAGYPDLSVTQADYWEKFWKIYNRLVDPSPTATRSHS